MKQTKEKATTYKLNDEPVALVREAEVTYDARGRKKNVILPYKTYEELMRVVEDMKDHKLMDEVANETDIPWEVAKRRLKKK